MTGTSDTKPIWPDRMPNVNVNAKIIDQPASNTGATLAIGANWATEATGSVLAISTSN